MNNYEKYYYYNKEKDEVVECTWDEYIKEDPKVRDAKQNERETRLDKREKELNKLQEKLNDQILKLGIVHGVNNETN